MILLTISLIVFLFAALWTVMARSLLRAAIGLALTSVVLTIIMFGLHTPLAAVFELSVCAGLISVIFITVISLTQALTWAEIFDHAKRRFVRFWLLPVLLLIVCGLLLLNQERFLTFPLPVADKIGSTNVVLWHLRQLDLVGQIIILLAGAFGVAILFKEKH